jgi:hypothetical protein
MFKPDHYRCKTHDRFFFRIYGFITVFLIHIFLSFALDMIIMITVEREKLKTRVENKQTGRPLYKSVRRKTQIVWRVQFDEHIDAIDASYIYDQMPIIRCCIENWNERIYC